MSTRSLICGLLLMILGTYTALFAQADRHEPRGKIAGQVIDFADKTAIEYAQIMLLNKQDGAMVSGCISGTGGRFTLTGIQPGEYDLKVQFMGYKLQTLSVMELKSGAKNVDLGKIMLDQVVLEGESIAIEAERSAFEYKIDKKVINVSQQQTAISGTAVDVLENVPSVTVDIDGNVSLRGSSSFMVLIDNRPSVLDANEILQQIPATTIDNIEIITNPSARFDPDGTSGIINIVTKKNQLNGVYGVVNLNGGLHEKYGGDFLINYRQSSYNLYLGGDYNKRNYPGSGYEESQFFQNDTVAFVNSDTESRRSRNSFGLRGGLDWDLRKKDRLSLGFRYSARTSERGSIEEFDEWAVPGLIHNYYFSQDTTTRSGNSYSINMDYVHRFAGKGHELSGQVHISRRDGDEEARNELNTADGSISSGQLSTEKGPSERITLKMDYVLPLNETDRFEAGYQSRLGRSTDITTLHEYDPLSTSYQNNPDFGHDIEYKRDIHSLYSLYAGQLGKLGYQGGLRTEYTGRKIQFIDIADKFTIDRWDYFPTAHVSYEITEGQQIMTSYTRRIKRPRGWYLEPFLTWSDAFNVRKGNPALKPEYIDSYETGYQTYFGENLFSAEAYYRITHNKIERVRSVYETNITLHTTENVGSASVLGSELMLNMDVFNWWNVNLMGNLYNYKVEGFLSGNSFSRESFNWNTRFNNTIKIMSGMRLQVNASYNSSTATSQGSSEGYFTANLGLRQEFFNRKLTATLQVRDVFASAKHESISEGTDYYSYRHYTREAPMVMLNLSYRINNHHKPERQRDAGEPEMGGEDEF